MGLFKRIGGLIKTGVGIATGNPGLVAGGIGSLFGGGKKRPQPVPAASVASKGPGETARVGVPLGLPGGPATTIPAPVMTSGRTQAMPAMLSATTRTRMPNDRGTITDDLGNINAALMAGRGTRSRASIFKMLLREGALADLVEEPIIYQGPNGSMKRGSYSGYVLYNWYEQGQRQTVQVPKWLAEKFGLTRRRRKPVISVRDTQAIRRAQSAKKRAAKLAKDAGLYVSMSRPKKSTTTRRR